MRYLYRNAQAFVFPSLYEGFGLPILEAFSCGCPVIASNSSSLPEIGGNAVQYFDPRDAASLQDAIDRVITNTTFRSDLKRKGDERLKDFSWKTSARKTKKVYEAVLSDPIRR
jgi:glycosyltransferase involved in cell wall biosynthesis